MFQKLIWLGFKVSQAQNGKQALELIHHHQFDLIILDLIMPIMSGEDTFRELQTLDDIPPTILVSGGIISPSLKKEIDSQAVYSLRKPYRSDDLVELISNIISLEST